MNRIQKLSAEVIAQIAAGQVVDRPVSIVKELVENALDADATSIVVKLEDGGKKNIVLVDNGCGMSEEEIKVAIQPHTTSKIRSVADLQSVHTLGFRGEALFSITQAADVYIQSRQRDQQVGTKVVVENGTVKQIIQAGMSVGTVIQVRNLFRNIPARRKFLKSATQEFQLILTTLTQLALAFPRVGFQLHHNGELVFDVLPHTSCDERVRAIIGESIETLFIPISLTVSEFTITGFIGAPQAATTVSQSQYLIVNQRPVTSPRISKTIKRAFKTLLPPGIQPPFVLYITVDPQTVDVNIHPQKREVRFTEEEILLQVLKTLVIQTLEKANLLFTITDVNGLVVEDSKMDAGTAHILREATQLWNVKEFYDDEPILQIDNLYLIAKTKQGALLIDQHAAHERILYEQFLESFLKQKVTQHTIQQPKTIFLPLLESQLLLENADTFTKLGFEFTQQSNTEFLFTRLPALFGTRKIEEYLLEVLQDIRDQIQVPDVDIQSHRTIAYLACRNAIKAGEVLTQTERRNIVTKLAATTSKYTCPHGRPVAIAVTSTDFAKLFYRIPAFRNE